MFEQWFLEKKGYTPEKLTRFTWNHPCWKGKTSLRNLHFLGFHVKFRVRTFKSKAKAHTNPQSKSQLTMEKEAKTLSVHQIFLGLKATLTGTMWKKQGMMIVELINFEGKCHQTCILCRRPSYSDTFGWQFQIYNVPSMYMTYLSMLISYVHGCSESLLTVKKSHLYFPSLRRSNFFTATFLRPVK